MKYLLIATYINIFATINVAQALERTIKDIFIPTKQETQEAERREGSLEQSLSSFYRVAERSNLAIRAIVRIAGINLRANNFHKEAIEIEQLWERFDGQLVDIALNKRDIGWFEPLSDTLAIIYEIMEQKLGFEMCHALRLDDLKTINFGLYVAFRPCIYGFDEFYKHLADDPKYRALLPVISYWSSVISCSVATHGLGYFFICSPIGWAIERVVEKRIAPRVTPKLYDMACTV